MKNNSHSSQDTAEAQPIKSRSREELAHDYGVSPRTFRRWLKRYRIDLPRGLVKPVDIRRIYERLGKP